MAIIRLLYHWGGGLVMAMAFLIGIPDSLSATKEFVGWASPYGMQPIHLAFWLLGFGAIYTTIVQGIRIKRFENARPRITVTPKIYYSDKAELEVRNDGMSAMFTATARVVRGITEPNLFNLYWKSYPNDITCPINKGGTGTILVAEISPNSEQNDNQRTAVFKGGIALYKVGGKRIGVSDYRVIDDAEWKKRYPSMFKNAADLVDECEIEVTITSDKELSKPFDNQRYLIKIDYQHGKLSITPLPNSDRKDFQN